MISSFLFRKSSDKNVSSSFVFHLPSRGSCSKNMKKKQKMSVHDQRQSEMRKNQILRCAVEQKEKA